jgi:hypothetical protein
VLFHICARCLLMQNLREGLCLRVCSLPLQDDPASNIPAALPTSYNSWIEPYCADLAPPGGYVCGGCSVNFMCCMISTSYLADLPCW